VTKFSIITYDSEHFRYTITGINEGTGKREVMTATNWLQALERSTEVLKLLGPVDPTVGSKYTGRTE